MTLYYHKLLVTLHLLSKLHIGVATTFSAINDPYNPNPLLYCTNRPLDDAQDLIVAHPKLPCGSRVVIYNLRTKRSVMATVADRGPRRAALDLSIPTARAIHSNGFELVAFLSVSK